MVSRERPDRSFVLERTGSSQHSLTHGFVAWCQPLPERSSRSRQRTLRIAVSVAGDRGAGATLGALEPELERDSRTGPRPAADPRSDRLRPQA